MAQEIFAFGDNSIDGQPCPVLASSFDVEGQALTVAEHYDEVVRDRYGLDEGTIPASVAESCWNDAVDRLLESSKHFEGRDDEHSDYLLRAHEIGRQVADELF